MSELSLTTGCEFGGDRSRITWMFMAISVIDLHVQSSSSLHLHLILTLEHGVLIISESNRPRDPVLHFFSTWARLRARRSVVPVRDPGVASPDRPIVDPYAASCSCPPPILPRGTIGDYEARGDDDDDDSGKVDGGDGDDDNVADDADNDDDYDDAQEDDDADDADDGAAGDAADDNAIADGDG
eukprot:6267721-Pyramimonas_sp.AAC.1